MGFDNYKEKALDIQALWAGLVCDHHLDAGHELISRSVVSLTCNRYASYVMAGSTCKAHCHQRRRGVLPSVFERQVDFDWTLT